MVAMMLSSTESEEVRSWSARVTSYVELLKTYSINFNVTKLASIRMGLLLTRDSQDAETEGLPDNEDSAARDTEDHDPKHRMSHVASAIVSSPCTAVESEQTEASADPTSIWEDIYGLSWENEFDHLLTDLDYNFGA